MAAELLEIRVTYRCDDCSEDFTMEPGSADDIEDGDDVEHDECPAVCEDCACVCMDCPCDVEECDTCGCGEDETEE